MVTYEWDRTRFELLDVRGVVLSTFAAQDVLKSFAVSASGSLFAQLSDRRVAEIDLRKMAVYEVVAGDRPRPSAEVISEVGAVLGVETVTVKIEFQHLVAWSDTASAAPEAFRQGAGIVVRAADTGAQDFALLFDGAAPGDWIYQAEFGIIAEADARARLLREVGRAVSFGPRVAVPASMFDGREFPPLSTFVDSSWRAPSRSVALPDASSLVSEATTHVNRLVEALHQWVHP